MDPEIQSVLKSFFQNYSLESFDKNQIIVKPKDYKIFFLTKGVVRMFSSSKKGRRSTKASSGSEGDEITLNIYKANSIFPMPLVFGLENKNSFSSLTKVQGYFAPKKDFERFVRKNPTIFLDLLKRIYQGLDGFFMIYEALLFRDAYYRILTQLIIYARRFGKEKEGLITFDWHLTHQHASQSGLARESVTREIKKLQDKGLIGYSGKKLFIYDLPKLEEECFTS